MNAKICLKQLQKSIKDEVGRYELYFSFNYVYSFGAFTFF